MHFQKIIDMNQTRSLLGSLIYQQQHCSQYPQCITLLERVNDSVLQIQNSWLLTLPAGGMNIEYLAQGPSSCSGACPVAWDIRTYCTVQLGSRPLAAARACPLAQDIWIQNLAQGSSICSRACPKAWDIRIQNFTQGPSSCSQGFQWLGIQYMDRILGSRPFKLQKTQIQIAIQ